MVKLWKARLSYMKALVVRLGQQPKVEDMSGDRTSLHKFVGGYINYIKVSETISLVSNEQGKLSGLGEHLEYENTIIYGDVAFFGRMPDGSLTDVPQEELHGLYEFIDCIRLIGTDLEAK